jgi:heme-degrading monooxygenase HmoA
VHIIIWEFSVRERYLNEFVSAYGSAGEWASLFARSDEYLGTELLRSSQRPGVFLTIDRWENSDSFQVFQNRHGDEYKKLDERLDAYVSAEKKLGEFSEA